MAEHTQPIPTPEEVDRALRRCWQPLARRQDLEQGPQRAVLLGEALAVFLTEDGDPAVIADRCPHRGASLSMGRVCGEALQCPYHGWEWGRDGRCLRIPSLADQSQIPPRARVPTYPAREQWGLIWTTLQEPVAEPPNVPWFDPNQWEWTHGQPFELPVAFGIMIENFRDLAHLAFVHRGSLGAVPEVVEPLDVVRDGLEVRMRRALRVGGGGDPIWGSLRELRTHIIAPNFTSALMIMRRGRRCLLHSARAVSASESIHYWLEGVSRDYDEFSLDQAIDAEETLYREDREIISEITPPHLPLGDVSHLSTLADRLTLAYREAFAQFVHDALPARSHRNSVVS